MTQKDEYYDLAKDLDEFVKDFDSYEYQDNVDDRESHINSLHSDLKQGKFADIENTLQEIIEEDNDAEAINLLDRIKRLPSYSAVKRDVIRKINKSIVHEDGTIDSFDKQLIQLMSGVYDTRFPLVVAEDTSSLNYIGTLSVENPLVINPSTVIKLREKHDIGYEFVSNCEKYLKESVLAFDSLQHKSSKVILLQEVDDDGFPMVAICRDNKDIGGNLMINEVTSIYDKKNLESLINRTYDDNKMFYKNKKTEQYIKSIGLQLSKGLITALSNNYNKPSFNKNQVDAELQSNGKNSILDKLKVEINDFNEPLLFDDNEYYFAYDIYCNDNLIASGQDSLENSGDISNEVVVQHVIDQIGYYVSKPNIHECSKIMQDCYKTCTESESGMCFLEAEFMDDYTSEDIKAFIDDIEKFKLNELCIIENYDSIEEAKKSGEAFATCYGALGSFFNNVTLEEQKETNKIKQLLDEMCSLEDCEEITTSINNGIDIDLSM